MKNVILTFALTSLFFVSVNLYCFMSGKIERNQIDYLTKLK